MIKWIKEKEIQVAIKHENVFNLPLYQLNCKGSPFNLTLNKRITHIKSTLRTSLEAQ